MAVAAADGDDDAFVALAPPPPDSRLDSVGKLLLKIGLKSNAIVVNLVLTSVSVLVAVPLVLVD